MKLSLLFLAQDASLSEMTNQALDGQSYNYLGAFVNMLLTLGFILGLIFVSVYFLKRVMRSRTHQLNRSTGIKILERRAINQKSALYLVDVLGKGIVLSESSGVVDLIAEFPDGVSVEALLQKVQDETEEIPQQETLLNKLRNLKRRNV